MSTKTVNGILLLFSVYAKFVLQLFLRLMAEVPYQLLSATNFSELNTQIFHRSTRSIIGWQSTEFAIAPIDVLFKLETLTFVTQIYLHPKKNKYAKALQVLISEDNHQYTSIAKIFDLNDAVRVEVSSKCRYIKIVILDKEHGKAASIDLMRIYGHPYFKYHEDSLPYSKKRQKIDQVLMQYGFNAHQQWDVDDQTLVTLHDMSKLQSQYAGHGQKQKLAALEKDLKSVLKIGKRIKQLLNEKKFMNARSQFQKIKDINDEVALLQQKRDKFDQKYETSRFWDMIAMQDYDNNHDQKLKRMLIQDRQELQRQKRRKQQQAMQRQMQLNKQFDQLNDQDDQWWKKENQLDRLQEEKTQKPKIEKPKKQTQVIEDDYKFKNPYVYNQGDADMEKYIKALLSQFGAHYVADPELLRKYEQMQYLDILGARIWISAHSQNWRQRAAAVEAVLKFSQDKLPERYNDGKTKNLFLALMEFARINAEDKVLQIYYTSLKIMITALQPPICGQDVPPVLINKAIQKFISILIEKISQMNSRAKEISLKQLITIFKHPVADLHIVVNQCLRVCKEELNLKFIPVDKQNPRIIISRLDIIAKLMSQFNFEKRKIDYQEILKLLIEGSLFHANNQVRMQAVELLELIYKANPQLTTEWYRSLKGLRPNIAAELEEKLHIN